jgi:hypothetical protein
MVTLELSAADLLRCRFAISPVSECVDVARTIANASARGAHGRWLGGRCAILQRIADTHDLRPLLALLAHQKRTPEFLRPVPDCLVAEIDRELEQVRSTAEERVAAEISRRARPVSHARRRRALARRRRPPPDAVGIHLAAEGEDSRSARRAREDLLPDARHRRDVALILVRSTSRLGKPDRQHPRSDPRNVERADAHDRARAPTRPLAGKRRRPPRGAQKQQSRRRARVGLHVLYSRTPLGEALLRGVTEMVPRRTQS